MFVRPPDSAGRSRSRRCDSDACVWTSAPCSRDRRGHRFEQLARARHGKPRRERGAQPAVGARRASAGESPGSRRSTRCGRLLQPRRHRRRPTSIMHLPIVARMPLSATASNTASVSCTVSIVSTVVVPLESSSVVASRAAARSDAGVCAASIGQMRVRSQSISAQIVGVAAEQRLAEMNVGLDEARAGRSRRARR